MILRAVEKMTIEEVLKMLEELSVIFGNSDGGWWYEMKVDDLIAEIIRREGWGK